MKELSIFIDESGDFGDYDPRCPFYIIAMVTHDQSNNVETQIKYLDRGLSETSLKRNFIHMGPLIRREYEYQHIELRERTKIFRKLMNFISKTDSNYKSFVVEKKHIEDEAKLTEAFVRQFSTFIKNHYEYFLSFDRLKIYYDNGQVGVTKIIIAVFTTLFDNVDFKKALQKDYKMLQVADLVCTATLTELKMEHKALSRSERFILGSDRDINKTLIKPLRKKEFDD